MTKIIAGMTLKCFKPRIWDADSPYYIPDLKAIMVSYAEFYQMPNRRQKAMDKGLHAYLGIPEHVKIYLDNGAFYFITHEGKLPENEYQEFVENAKPDWYPIPQDFIPTPKMTEKEQKTCFRRTMAVNRKYHYDGYVPVIHISRFLENYFTAVRRNKHLKTKTKIALGAIVPNLLRAPKALRHSDILKSLQRVRKVFQDKEIHIFGIGGTATLHVAALLKMDSIDSSGWRNRAARGIIQLPGSGDRAVADLGKWKIRTPTPEEWEQLMQCPCPACQKHGIDGLKLNGIEGFCNRATHNLWVLLNEAKLIEQHLSQKTYPGWYKGHLNNSIYLPLIEKLIDSL
jgi:7-cyano-7-deazaguanine tRNA-ribosyltransferase